MPPPTLSQQAEGLLASGHVEAAVKLLQDAARGGDVGALFTLATWYLAGEKVPRDLPAARMLLRQAVEIGHVDGALMEVALTANGSGGVVSWSMALSLLKTAAKSDPWAHDHLALLDAMAISPVGDPLVPPKGQLIGTKPNVLYFQHLLSAPECAHLAGCARDLLEPAKVIDPATGLYRLDPVRTSLGSVIGPAREDLVVGAINRRIAAISSTSFDQGEPLAILCYQPGQQYHPHHDALPNAVNQRIKTVIIYLNEGFGGGQTQFLANGLIVEPKAGDAIMFDNVDSNGAIDLNSRHAGLPVTQGNKWIATRWIRQDRYDPWNPN